MKKRALHLTVTAMVLCLTGCLPEEFMWWSPDGQTAAIRTSEGLRLADTNGHLSGVVLPGEIQSAAWLPDSKGLLVSRTLKVNRWAEAKKLIPPEEAAATMELARAIPDLLKAALTASGGSWEKVEDKFLKPLGMSESKALDPAWSCALSLHREPLLDALAGFTNTAALKKEILSSETNGISIYELTFASLGEDRSLGAPRALLRSLSPLSDPKVSPEYPVVAFRTGEAALKCITLDAKSSVMVADADVTAAAWSADGRTLFHIVKSKTDKLGEIRSRSIVSTDGELWPQPAPAETLALAAFVANVPPKICVLPDGNLLFASVPATLPARPASVQPAAQFFLLNPGVAAPPTQVILWEGSLPEDLSAFVPSPDGRLVAVVEGGTDAVAVLELASGIVKIISPPHAGWKSHMLPAWRNNRELTFSALPSITSTRPELHLWQEGAPHRVLSKDWPESVIKPWLEAPAKSAEQPSR